MPYEPRTTTTIRRELAARIVARGGLDDVSEGSALAHMIQAWAEEMANVELRLARIRDAFFIDSASGTDLDDRIADLPPDGLARLAPSSASGGVLTLLRVDTAAPLTVLAGATYGRGDDATLVYRQTADATFGVGVAAVGSVPVICLTPGAVGNAPAGALDRVVSAVGVTGVISAAALTNGRDEESDDAVRARARSYLSSLTGSTPAALEYLGLSFTAADGSRAAFARVFEDPAQAGLCELLLDDGNGLVGYRRDGAVVTGTVPAGGPPVLWHEAPATQPITVIDAVIGGVPRQLQPGEFTSIPERGLVYVEDGIMASGDTWTIGTTKYQVFFGLPAELQALIEGDTSDPLNLPGYRAAGVRVRVLPPTVYLVQLAINVVPVLGRDYDAVAESVRRSVVEYMATLGPGETMFVARLIDRIMDSADVLTVRIYNGGVVDLVPADDVIPPDPRWVLRTTLNKITVVPLAQEV
jgi:hypothetical protein